MECKFLKSILVIFLIIFNTQAYSVDFNPFSLEPGLVGKNLSTSPAYTSLPSSPSVQHQAPTPPPINPEAYKIFFELKKVIIKGNTAFSTAELQTVFAPYMHRKISVAKLQLLVESITDKYQKEGYFLSKALLPPQKIANGTVQVTVVEGFISQIEIQGLKRPGLNRFLKRQTAIITKEKPIKLADLEHYLLLINDVPGFKIKSVLSPDEKVPLGAKLTLVTEYTPWSASLLQDNYQTRFLGPDETTLFTSLNSVFIPGGTLYARAIHSDQDHKLQFYELRHDQVLASNGMVFSLDGYVTKTHPLFILTPLEIFGQSNDVNGTLIYPIIRSRERTLQLFGQAEFMRNNSTSLSQVLYIDKITDGSLGIQYNDVRWKGEDSISLILSEGYNSPGKAAPSRLGAEGSYFKVNTIVSRNQIINTRFSLFALITAQTANAVLPAAETFIFGGPFLGRGYDWAQFTGDRGVAGKVEFRVNTNPNLLILRQAQYFAFYDVGKVWSLIPRINNASGASAGFGMRAGLIPHVNVEAFFGRPLTTPNATQVILKRNGKAFLGFFQVSAFL